MKNALILLPALLAAAACGEVSVVRGTAYARTAVPKSLSGITFVGGNRFWTVADDGSEGGVYECEIDLNDAGTAISAFSICSTNDRVRLGSASDLEGCAFDPATGNVWASDEGGRSIREYDSATGEKLRSIAIPAILSGYRYNFGFEALTISGDGLSLWTANEEALECDGAVSSHAAGTTVRLAKFTRRSVRDVFSLEAMYAYTTDPWTNEYNYSGKARCGVAGLCALPDGSLLVLERELSFSGTSGLALYLGNLLAWKLYRVADPGAATDVKDWPSLKEDGWTGTEKELLASDGGLLFATGNFEGVCLGPRLADGSLSVLLISDSGDGYSRPMLYPLVLSGLDVHTLDFPEPDASLGADAAASLVGSNYRLLAGTHVESALSGSAAAAARYAEDGSSVPVPEWSLASDAASGEGAVASFEVAGDDTLLWTGLSVARPVETFVIGHDTFEEYAVGATAVAGALRGWSGSTGSKVVAGMPDVGAAGLPMSAAPHEHVLAVPLSAYRNYGNAPAGNQKFELMFRVAPNAGIGFYDADGDWFASLFVSDDGTLVMQHADANRDFAEAVLDAGPFAWGDWIRLGFFLDRTTDPTFLEASVDGTPRASEHGVRSPADPVVPSDASGTWHRTRLHPAGGISEVRIYGDTAVDDVLLATVAFPTESAPGYLRADGVPSDWIRARGLEPVFEDLSAPTAIRDGDRVYTLGDAFTAGVDPDGTAPLRETEVELLPDGRVRIVLNGVRPDNAAAYAVYGATDLSALSTDDDSLVVAGSFQPDPAKGRTVWTSAAPVGEAAFFRVKASR
jgi:hypothetical protein